MQQIEDLEYAVCEILGWVHKVGGVTSDSSCKPNCLHQHSSCATSMAMPGGRQSCFGAV